MNIKNLKEIKNQKLLEKRYRNFVRDLENLNKFGCKPQTRKALVDKMDYIESVLPDLLTQEIRQLKTATPREPVSQATETKRVLHHLRNIHTGEEVYGTKHNLQREYGIRIKDIHRMKVEMFSGKLVEPEKNGWLLLPTGL